MVLFIEKIVLGTFTKAFFSKATSFFPTTSQMCNFPSGNLPKIRPSEAPQAAKGAERQLGQAWEVAAWEITHLGICHLGKYRDKL